MVKKIQKKLLSFTVIYEVDQEGGYVASVPSLSGCYSQGETLEETEKNIKEAIEAYLESLLTHREALPQEPKIFQGKVEVAV